MMKKNLLMSMIMLLTIGGTFTACSSSDDTVPTTPVSLSVEMPLGIENAEFTNGKAVFTNVTTNETYTVSQFVNDKGTFTASVASVPEGTYNVAITGDLSFTKDGVAGTTKVDQKNENVVVKSGNANVKMAVNTFDAKGGFVISELFYTGTTTPEGKQYLNDQYVVISNNSDVTLYADSIAFVESAFTTTQKFDYTPNIMADYMTVDAIYMIPGNGKSVPVEPGKSLVLAVNARNHAEANPNSFDLSKADYEFYDESSVASQLDYDNPDVSNLDKWFCYTNSRYVFTNRGNKAYAIAKMRGDKKQFIADNSYEPAYKQVTSKGTIDMVKKNCLKLSNSWVIDAVNLSTEKGYVWQVVSSSLDAGWAHCGTSGNDKNRYNTAVIRKKENNKWIDTNNSTNDFISDATPSYLKK